MKNHKNHIRIILIFLCLFLTKFNANAQHGIEQDNPVLTPNVAIVPTIDGMGNDDCWQNVPWQRIAQVWIPYGATVDSVDYYGRYKVVWSSTTNLLYFLMEVNDDVFVDGYTPSGGGAIYDYDISEIFIDENKSGGDHIFDTGTTNIEQVGTMQDDPIIDLTFLTSHIVLMEQKQFASFPLKYTTIPTKMH